MVDIDSLFAPSTESEAYLLALFGAEDFQAGRICLIINGSFNRSRYFDSVADASAFLSSGKATEDVFVAVNLTLSESQYSRGTVEDISGVTSVYVDIDFAPDGWKTLANGKQVQVPRSLEECLKCLEELQHKPNLIVASGGGIHAYWVFSTIWYPEDREEAKRLVYGWRQHVAAVFREKFAYHIDHVGDLARVLRVPGFPNSKHAGIQCSLLKNTVRDIQYTPADFGRHSCDVGVSAEAIADLEFELIDIPDEVYQKLSEPSKLKMIWEQDESVTPSNDQSQSGWDMALVMAALRSGIREPSVLWAMIREYRQTHCVSPASAAKGARLSYAKSTISRAIAAELDRGTSSTPLEDFAPLAIGPWDDPARIAERVEKLRPHMLYYLENWYVWGDGEAYEKMSKSDMNAFVYRCCEEAAYDENEKRNKVAEFSEEKPKSLVKASKSMMVNVIECMQSRRKLPDTRTLPTWVSGHGPCSPHEVLPVQNGILDIKRRVLISSTPNFFCVGRSNAVYNPDATCDVWKNWLTDVFETDTQSIELLQEWCGYLISGDISQQKMLIMGGASRAGKGTIGRVMTKLVGQTRTSTPTIASLSDSFGLEPLQHSSLAFCGDVKFTSRTVTPELTQFLLGWVGGDSFNIQRKFRETIQGVQPTARIVMATNGIPNFAEASEAMVNRILFVRFSKSFAGKEDRTLDQKFSRELSGILNWALDGYARLVKRGYFVQPKTGEDIIQLMREADSPVYRFVKQCCERDERWICDKKELYELYKAWLQHEDPSFRPLNVSHFYRQLYSCAPQLREVRFRDRTGARPLGIKGIKALITKESFDFLE